MYYSVVLMAENQKRMFAINAELVSGNSDMFTAVMSGLSNYRMNVPLIDSKRKCKRFAHEIGALCTFHHSYEEIINAVYNHKFYRTEKVYEIPFTKDEPVDPYYIAKLIREHFGYKVDINNDEDFMDIVNRNRVILRKIK